MKLCFSYFLLLFSITVQSQSRSLCEVPPELESAYVDQVKSLALDQMLNSGTADTSLIRIPESYYTPVYEALAAIYNSPFTEHVDTLFNIYCINNDYSDEYGYTLKGIYVKLDTSVAWTESWENNIVPSGNPFIDSILLGITYTVHTSFNTVRRLVFHEVLNLASLVNLLGTVEGIIYTEQIPAYGDFSHITHHQEDDDHYFNFVLGWDDCPSGCISTRTWEFLSNISTCEAQLESTYGRPVTFWYNEPPYAPYCNLKSSDADPPRDANISLYPNPSDDILHLTSEKTIHFLDIYNLMGTHITHKKVNSSAISEDISYLTPGVYVIILNAETFLKFIKA